VFSAIQSKGNHVTVKPSKCFEIYCHTPQYTPYISFSYRMLHLAAFRCTTVGSMKKNSKKQIEGSLNWEAVQRFNENRPALPARSVLRSCRKAIVERLVMGFLVEEIAQQLTEEFNLAKPIKPSSLRTWLCRHGISANAVRKGVVSPGHQNQTAVSIPETHPVIQAPSKTHTISGGATKPTHKISLLEKAKAQLADQRQRTLDSTNQS